MSSIPGLTGMHPNGDLVERAEKLRKVYAQMLQHPAAEASFRRLAQHQLQTIHMANVELFGWRDAEVIRAEAFTDAVENTVPVADAVESDFADFEAVQRQQGGAA